MDLSGTFALVTGGSRGIGRAIAQALAGAGAAVAIGYRAAAEQAQELARAVPGGRGFAVQLDVRDDASCKRAWAAAQERFGGQLNLLVNSAGVAQDRALALMSDEQWAEVLDTNLGGVFRMCRAAYRDLLRQDASAVINVASVAGLKGVAGQTNYGASKAGIIGFTRSLAAEGASGGLRANVIAPGYIQTEMLAAMKPKALEAALQRVPLKRLGTPEDVAGMALFLASPLSSYVTGQVFVVDGGLTL